MTWVILKVTEKTVGLRVDEESEIGGLDLSEHSEVGYTFSDRGGSLAHGAATRGERSEARVAPTRVDAEEPTHVPEPADLRGGVE